MLKINPINPRRINFKAHDSLSELEDQFIIQRMQLICWVAAVIGNRCSYHIQNSTILDSIYNSTQPK